MKLFLIPLINHLKSSELSIHASKNRFFSPDGIKAEIPFNSQFDYNILCSGQFSLVQSIAVNTVSKLYPGFLPLRYIIKSLLHFLCLGFWENCLASKIYMELPGMFRMNQTLKRGRKKNRNSFRIFFFLYIQLSSTSARKHGGKRIHRHSALRNWVCCCGVFLWRKWSTPTQFESANVRLAIYLILHSFQTTLVKDGIGPACLSQSVFKIIIRKIQFSCILHQTVQILEEKSYFAFKLLCYFPTEETETHFLRT